MTDRKRYISTSARPMANKLERVMGFIVGLLSTKSHNLLITWSHKVIYQMKNVINLCGYVRSSDYFTKPVATKLDRVIACEIKISTTV